MRLHLGRIPESSKFHPEARGWRPLPYDSLRRSMAIALPVAILLFVALRAFAEILDFGGWGEGRLQVAVFLPMAAASIVVHEILHTIAHPGWGRSKRSFIGLWPTRLIFFSHYEGRMSRNRFVVLILLPVSVLAMPPLVVCAAAGFSREWVALLAALNGAFGAGDLVGAVRVLRYVPRNATVRNRGWYTWWRADAETMARVLPAAPEAKRKGLGKLVPAAKWAGVAALLFVSVSLVFEPFLGGHSHAKNDLLAPTRVFEPGHGYQPMGAAGDDGTVRLWRGAPDWPDSRPELSRAVWRAGYRFQMWKRGVAVVIVDEQPEEVGNFSDVDRLPLEEGGDAQDVEETADDGELDDSGEPESDGR